MSDVNIASLADKLQDLDLFLRSQHSKEVGYGRRLREAIVFMDPVMEVEVLKSLGDLHLQNGKHSKDSADVDKAAALYAAALLRCPDPDMGETLDHRIGYMEKLSRQLLQGYTPQYECLSPDYWGNADSNILRVTEICEGLDRSLRTSHCSVEETYTEMLVTAVTNGDVFLELEVLKSFGDFYLENGKKTLDASQFSKAAAMYNKALTRCEDHDTEQTLNHRILYMEKLSEAARRVNNHLEKGDEALAREDLVSAERIFAAALKVVHVKDPSAQQYQREVEPLCKLGEVYCKRGQQTGDGGDFVKAAALYIAAMARSEDEVLIGNIEIAIKEIEKVFIICVLDISENAIQDDREKHKKHLKELRDQIKLEMETIDLQLDPYVHDDGEPCVKEIEAQRAQAVRQLFDKIAQQRKQFISLLVEECIGLMGPPPCKYALIGLGSQATRLATPYSDLEFAILVEEESEECLKYFRNLTHYLHLKVVNLGETILPALGIKSLNDFYSWKPLGDWYYDSVTPRGFAFDGSMPKASKTPLGRQGTGNKRPSELICTPENMVTILQNDVTIHLKKGYHLASILRNPCLITGDQCLIDTYLAITVKILQADGGKIAQQLAQEVLKEDIDRYSKEHTITGRLIDVKKEIYRFPALAVDCLALSSHIMPTTVWSTIEELENEGVISPNNAHHLTVLTSISAELRLRTYIANGGQNEKLSALASMATALNGRKSPLQTNVEVQKDALQPIFHLPNEKQLFRYYYTAVTLKNELSQWSGNIPVLNSFSEFYENSPRVRGRMYSELLKYQLAIRCYRQALEKADEQDTETMMLLGDIGSVWEGKGDGRKAISYYEHAMKMYRSIYGQTTAHPYIRTLLNNLGLAWAHLGDFRKTISCYQQVLQMCKSTYGGTTAHPDIATSLNNMGSAWDNLGDYRKAISYYEQALQMERAIYGQTTAHPGIASSLQNLGSAWDSLGDYRKAISYCEQALQMNISIYGQTTIYPSIAISLNSLGTAWNNLGDHRKAISYHKQALQMHRGIYGQTTAHPRIASTINNLGFAWHRLGNHTKAISYYEQALQMRRSMYGQTTAHPDVANSLNTLGGAWHDLGDLRKAINYYEQALKMSRSIYGQGRAHNDIAASLNNLGGAWSKFGDHRKAISYYEQAQQMFRNIYGQTTAHPDIATSLNNLGAAWDHLGDYRKSNSYYEQALQMRRSIYGQTTANPDIATSLNNLGLVCCNLGDYRKAISYHERALEMKTSIYGQKTAHPDIATSLNNLGLAWSNLGDHSKAIRYHEQALQMGRSIFGQTTAHPDIASSLGKLGEAYMHLSDYRKAIRYIEQALQMYRITYGQTTAHPDIATSLNNLGHGFDHLRNHRKAISYFDQAVQMYRRIYGPTTAHPHIASSLNNQGMGYLHMGDHRKAIAILEEAVPIVQQAFCHHNSHPLIRTIERNLSIALMCSLVVSDK